MFAWVQFRTHEPNNIMLSTKTSLKSWSKTAFAVLGLCTGLCAISTQSARAEGTTTALATSADKTSNAPLTATFEKTGKDKTPYVLHLKNTSSNEVTATGKILLASAFHSETKAKMLKEHKIAAGETWTIKHLSADDKVIIMPEGFDRLELTVK